jgi:hypothetical protein
LDQAFLLQTATRGLQNVVNLQLEGGGPDATPITIDAGNGAMFLRLFGNASLISNGTALGDNPLVQYGTGAVTDQLTVFLFNSSGLDYTGVFATPRSTVAITGPGVLGAVLFDSSFINPRALGAPTQGQVSLQLLAGAQDVGSFQPGILDTSAAPNVNYFPGSANRVPRLTKLGVDASVAGAAFVPLMSTVFDVLGNSSGIRIDFDATATKGVLPGTVFFRVLVNAVSIGARSFTAIVGENGSVAFSILNPDTPGTYLAQGTHTIDVEWRASAGDATIPALTLPDEAGATLIVTEVPNTP